MHDQSKGRPNFLNALATSQVPQSIKKRQKPGWYAAHESNGKMRAFFGQTIQLLVPVALQGQLGWRISISVQKAREPACYYGAQVAGSGAWISGVRGGQIRASSQEEHAAP